jgi:hypothetical protein
MPAGGHRGCQAPERVPGEDVDQDERAGLAVSRASELSGIWLDGRDTEWTL